MLHSPNKRTRYRFFGLIAVVLCATFLLDWPAIAWPDSDNDLETLRRVQAKVQEVARKNMNVVVAVTDGVGYGSGVIVSEDGLVLTAGHVMLTGGTDFRVIFPDGREAKAESWGRNLDVDAGMVRIIEAGPWQHAEIGDSSSLQKGDWCVCLGHSGGYELGRRPPVRAGRVVDFEPDQLITDCPLIGGDSGGPLFDLEGKVIGIHSSIGSSIIENRHVAIGTFKKHWARMIAGEKWGQLPELAGKKSDPQNPDSGNNNGPKPSMGIRIDRASDRARILLVHAGGAAEAAGVMPGDIVVVFDEHYVDDSQHLIELIAQRQPGDTIQMTVKRGGSELPLIVILGQR